MKNPFLRVRTWVYFVLSHLWWILGLLTLPFCSGALGIGYTCALPIFEGIAATVEISTIFVIPVVLPILLYFYLINEWRVYRGKEKIPIVKMLLILCGTVAVLALALTLLRIPLG